MFLKTENSLRVCWQKVYKNLNDNYRLELLPYKVRGSMFLDSHKMFEKIKAAPLDVEKEIRVLTQNLNNDQRAKLISFLMDEIELIKK